MYLTPFRGVSQHILLRHRRKAACFTAGAVQPGCPAWQSSFPPQERGACAIRILYHGVFGFSIEKPARAERFFAVWLPPFREGEAQKGAVPACAGTAPSGECMRLFAGR